MIAKTSWAHRCAVLLAIVAFLCVATGTAVTSSEERPYYSLGQTHAWLASAVSVLTVILATLIFRTHARGWIRRSAWMALGLVVAQAVLGLQPLPQAPPVRIAHAFLGQMFFPLTLVMAVYTSNRFAAAPAEAESTSWILLLTKMAPCAVLAQIALGTLFRHGAMGLGPHLLGAFIVVVFALCLALPVISQPGYSSLHNAARIFLTIASIQVLLGFALFMMQIMEAPPEVTILATLIHAAMATLTLATILALAVLIRHGSRAPAN